MRETSPVTKTDDPNENEEERSNKRVTASQTDLIAQTDPTLKSARIGPREPIYLASQLASICDVDLKTIHNWCDRNAESEGGQLECFRTPGGHLRFRQSAVLRFLSRWGYPIPDALLRDRPHVLFVEPNEERRKKILLGLGLTRPGQESETIVEPADGQTLGLFANPRWYAHFWEDPYAALIAVGERAGAGAPFDLAVLSVPLSNLSEQSWIRSMLDRSSTRDLRFILVTSDEDNTIPKDTQGIVGVVQRSHLPQLSQVLEDQATQLIGKATSKTNTTPTVSGRKRRASIAPREPIFVASEVADIWEVDLKTVHNWVERGDIEAFCTPGRHLRFRRRSLLHFLRRYNMNIPPSLMQDRPRVVVVDRDVRAAKRIATLLEERFDVGMYADPIGALAEIGSQCAGAGLVDAAVVSFPLDDIDDVAWIRSLSSHPDTCYTRLVVVSATPEKHKVWQDLGAIATVSRSTPEQIPAVLERVLGLTHQR